MRRVRVVTPSLDRVAGQYREAFRRHGDSPAAVLWPKGRQDLRFAALTRFMAGSGFSVLDFGCGLAHLLPYLNERFRDVRYTGVDVLPEFVDACRKKFPAEEFRTARAAGEITGAYDYVVISGTFNLLYDADAAVHQRLVFENLRELFGHATRLLAVNFMSDRVDYQQEGAYHQDVGPLLSHRELAAPWLIKLLFWAFLLTVSWNFLSQGLAARGVAGWWATAGRWSSSTRWSPGSPIPRPTCWFAARAAPARSSWRARSTTRASDGSSPSSR